MTDHHPDNPPAFPCMPQYDLNGQLLNEAASGMTLRDYLAAKAMQATPPDYFSDLRSVAVRAYELADAMLAERSRKP